MAAIEATGSVLHTLKADVFSEFFEIVLQSIKPAKETDASDSEDEAETKRQNSAAKLNLQATVFQAIGLAWPDSTHTQAEWYGKVTELLSSSLPKNNWKVQVAILESLSNIYSSLKYTLIDSEREYFSSTLIPNLCQCLGNVKYSAVRHKSLSALDKLTDYLQEIGHVLPASVQASVRESLQTCIEEHQYQRLAQSISSKLILS